MQVELKLKKGRMTMKTIQVVAAIVMQGSCIFATQRGYGEFKDGFDPVLLYL